MNVQTGFINSKTSKFVYIVLIIILALPINEIIGLDIISPAIALLAGLLFASVFSLPFPTFNKKCSKYLLQASVVGLGFGMNFHQSLQAGKDGMIATIISVIVVMILGVTAGKMLKIDKKISYLIGSGTAICGGSAIAAIGPVIKASSNQMAIALGTVFILNAVALFIFPPIGHLLDMSQTQFGTWAAIAIHDTSSVVGAGQEYGNKALEVATLIKLTRALWIIPLAIVTTFVFREKSSKISIPWFILLFIIAMLCNTYLALPEGVDATMIWLAKKGMVITLFLIGSGLSIGVVKEVGIKPILLGVLLWVVIGIGSLASILAFMN